MEQIHKITAVVARDAAQMDDEAKQRINDEILGAWEQEAAKRN